MMCSDTVLRQLLPEQVAAVVIQEGIATQYPWTAGMYKDCLRPVIGSALIERDTILGLAVVTSAVARPTY